MTTEPPSLRVLERLRDAYYDPDGEYTSGRSDIGTVVEKIRTALKSIGQ